MKSFYLSDQFSQSLVEFQPNIIRDKNNLHIVLAAISILSFVLFFSFARSSYGLWIILICALWCLYNPYLFVVVTLPSLMVLSDAPAFPGSTWSVLRLVFIIIVVGIALRPKKLVKTIKMIPPFLLFSMLALLIIYFLSGLYNGWQPYVSEKLTSHILRIGLVLIVFVSIFTLDNIKLLFWGLTLQGIVMAVSGLIIWNEFGTFMAIRYIRVGYAMGNPLLIFASYGVSYATFNVTSGLACISLGTMATGLKKGFFLLVGTLIILSSIMSGRRAAVIATILALLLILYLLRNKNAVLLLLILILVSVPLAAGGYFDQFFSSRETIMSEFTGGGTGRLDLIKTGFNKWLRSPVWGYGPGSQPEVYDEAHGASHNTLISALLEGGIFAIFPVLFILAGIVLQTIRTSHVIRYHQADVYYPIAFLASLANILVLSLISGDIIATNNGIILLTILTAYNTKTLINLIDKEKS